MEAQADPRGVPKHVQADESSAHACPTEEPRNKCEKCKQVNASNPRRIDPSQPNRFAPSAGCEFCAWPAACTKRVLDSNRHRYPNLIGGEPKRTRAGNEGSLSCPTSQQATTGTPRPRTFLLSRQVSWLADHCLCLAFPTQSASVTIFDSDSPLTVAGAAPALPKWAHRFPS